MTTQPHEIVNTRENRDARKAALVAYGAYGQTLNREYQMDNFCGVHGTFTKWVWCFRVGGWACSSCHSNHICGD